ncbi:TPA: hypothetical protein OUB95_002663 [Proteus mirabilis]|nr:hypothetical protein [Proteus mirabilis]
MSKEYPEVVCDCQLPDDCTLEVEIEFGNQKETYRQKGFSKKFFHLIDFNGKYSTIVAEAFDFDHLLDSKKEPSSFLPEILVPLKVNAYSKMCVSNNPECPVGNLYGDIAYNSGEQLNYNSKLTQISTITNSRPVKVEKHSFIDNITPIKPMDTSLVYTKQLHGFGSEVIDPFEIFNQLLVDVWQDVNHGFSFERLRHVQKYQLSFSECGHKPLKKKMHDAAYALAPIGTLYSQAIRTGKFLYETIGTKFIFDTTFYLVLQQETKIDLKISFKEKTEAQSDKERIKLTTANNEALGRNRSKPRSGWTKSGTELCKSSITLKGYISHTLGMDKIKWNYEKNHEYSKLKKKKDLSILEKINKGVDSFNKILSSVPDKSPNKYEKQEYDLVKFELIYPTIEASLERKLALIKNDQIKPKYEIYIGGKPFFGFKFTFDMIQAFAAYFGINSIVTVIREKGTEDEEEVKRGEDGAFIGAQLDLIFNVSLNCGLKYKTDDEGITKFDQEGSGVELPFKISCETNIRGGVQYYGISGFFKAEAKIETTLKAGWAPSGNGEIVFYHKGIKAYASVEYGIGIAKADDKKDQGFEPVNKKSHLKVDVSDRPYDKEWIILDPLPKDKSTYRWQPFN